MKNIPARKILLVNGDFNAKIGKTEKQDNTENWYDEYPKRDATRFLRIK